MSQGSFSHKFNEIYRRLSEIYPDKPWIKIVEQIRQTEKKYPMRVGQAEVMNWFAFSLTRWERNQDQFANDFERTSLIEAMLLSERLCRFYEVGQKEDAGPKKLLERFRGALRNPDDLRAIRFELFVADFLQARDCEIFWPEEVDGSKTFDLLVKPPGSLPVFELECKSYGGEKGFSISLLDGQRLMEACLNIDEVGNFFDSRVDMASVLSVVVSEQIPADEKNLKRMANEIIQALKTGDDPSPRQPFTIQHEYCKLLGDPQDSDSCYRALSLLPGSTIAVVVFGSNESGWKSFRIAWSGKSTLWKKVEDSMRYAIDKQLTKSRPGGVALQFINDTAETFSTVGHPGNRFRKLAEKAFTREHVALVMIAGDFVLVDPDRDTHHNQGDFAVDDFKSVAFGNPTIPPPASGLYEIFSDK